MKFNLYNDVKAFYEDARGVLMRHEAQNLIPLGNLVIGNEGADKTGWRDPAAWFMALISDDKGARLTAIMTPPHNLTLYATDNQIDDEAIACLIKGIDETGSDVPGVMTEKRLAERFAQAFAAARGVNYAVYMKQRIYELSRVNPQIPLIGSLRPAQEKDISFIPFWIEGFNSECFGRVQTVLLDTERFDYEIMTRKLYILEDNGTPVSMAKITREIQTVCGVGFVYTPPYLRSKGYATSCVARISSIALECGFTKCVLYTDLANPVSNSIYQKIGYAPVCDSLEIKFEKK